MLFVHRLNVHGFGWTRGAGDGQGGLACCNSWGRKELDTTESRPGHRALARSSLLRDWFPCAGAVLSLAQTHRGRPQTTSTRLYE